MEWLLDLPRELWAFLGIVVGGFLAWLRERYKTDANITSSPYEAMATRLERVEQRAAIVPELTARFSILADWATEAADWMEEIYNAYEQETGMHYFPPPPHPPPSWDRRVMNYGPPPGYGDRRSKD